MSFVIVTAGGGHTEDDPITFSSDDEDEDLTLAELQRRVTAPNEPNEKYIFRDETSRNEYGGPNKFVPRVGDVVVSRDYFEKDEEYSVRHSSFEIKKITDKGTVMVTQPHDNRVKKLPIYDYFSHKPVVYYKRNPGESYRSGVGRLFE